VSEREGERERGRNQPHEGTEPGNVSFLVVVVAGDVCAQIVKQCISNEFPIVIRLKID